MNTRRKFVQPKPDAPSTRWHLMNEPYKELFLTEAHKHVEDWYNLGATGVQRDLFRDICAEIYQADPNAPEPASTSPHTALVQTEEADLMIKYFAKTLTPLGKQKARSWILHSANRRRRDNFRDVFAGCQTVFEKKSVMHKDFTAPESSYYGVDSTHFHRSVDWTSLKARKEMQTLQAQRAGGAEAAQGSSRAPEAFQRPSVIVDAQTRAGKPRVTKPKSQFDGVNHLASLGYASDVPADVAIEELKAKHRAFAEEKRYYVDKDGSTVYVAANAAGGNGGRENPQSGASVAGGGILAAVTSDPMTQWKVKTVDY